MRVCEWACDKSNDLIEILESKFPSRSKTLYIVDSVRSVVKSTLHSNLAHYQIL